MIRHSLLHRKVAAIAAYHLDASVAAVEAGTSFKKLGADSLTMVELTLSLEEEFGVDVPDDLALKLLNARQVTEWLQTRLQEAAGAGDDRR